MSIFGAMQTGVSGLKSFGIGLNHISDNIANINTIGYKRVETRFSTLITTSNAKFHESGGVTTTPSYRISTQGALEQSDVSTNLSISGNGMFVVSPTLNTNPTITFGSNTLYTRAGDFTSDKNGYLQNGVGNYLQGWATDSSGNVLNTSQLIPIKVTGVVDAPVQTSEIKHFVNIPAAAAQATATEISGASPFASPAALKANTSASSYNSVFGPSQTLFYDALGGQHTMSFYWTKLPAGWGANTATATFPGDNSAAGVAAGLGAANTNKWILTVIPTTSVPGATIDVDDGTHSATQYEVGVEFYPDGTLAGVYPQATIGTTAYGSAAGATPADGPNSIFSTTENSSANFTIPVKFGGSYNGPTEPQNISINLGTYATPTDSTTQWNEADISIRDFRQNGIPAGTGPTVSIDDSGYVQFSFSNGTTKPGYKIPLARFDNYDGLQLTSGNAYIATSISGDAFYSASGENGTGTISGSKNEKSNVDIADEFTKMIVVQRAYSANAKLVTTASDMLQEVIGIVR